MDMNTTSALQRAMGSLDQAESFIHAARRFMDVARVYVGKTAIVADLDPSALYELAAGEALQAVIHMAGDVRIQLRKAGDA
jgi:hypothetical protein